MKVYQLLQLAPLATAFVVPDQQVFQQLSIDTQTRQQKPTSDLLSSGRDVWDSLKSDTVRAFRKAGCHGKQAHAAAKNALDDGFEVYHKASSSLSQEFFDARTWAENNLNDLYESWDDGRHDGPPHHGPPHHGPPHDKPPHDGPPHHGPPHRGGPHRGHHKPNQTVYELISTSKYTSRLAELINEYPDLVKALNGTSHNYTVFAPINAAFEKIPEKAPKPSKEFLEKILSYHVSPGFYPAGRVLVTHTVPTLLKGQNLSESGDNAQRLSLSIGLRGLAVNHYSRVIGVNFFGTNGVVHGIDSLLLPPPPATKIISFLPSEFSTLELALTKTGLLELFKKPHSTGGTLFAPSNFAFQKLGPGVNAFLFSDHGLKYLKALLEYHVVPEIILYSDAVYNLPKDANHKHGRIPAGKYHIDLPTLLKDRSLSVDIFRYGGFIPIKINGFARVVIEDGIASDGVIQVVGDVIIPPKKLGGDEAVMGEMTVDEFKSRFEGLF